MHTFSELKQNLKKDFDGLPKIKVAVLGDSATQLLVQGLRGTGYAYGYDLEIWEADYDQVERQLADPQSNLYQFAPEILVIFQSSHKLLNRFNKLDNEARPRLAATELAKISEYYDLISSRLQTKIIYYNYPEIDDSVFGNFANQQSASFLFQIRKLNFELMELAVIHPDLYICDLSAVQNSLSKLAFFPTTFYINSSITISLDAIPHVAKRTLDIISALKGKINKCLIVDLDNTMWGGVIGDDGVENLQLGDLGIGKAFVEFQYWILKLKQRGVVIAVCSKNTESVAKEAFENHPDMVLSLDDISVFVANWENKADNIRYIQQILNIGFDSMVFLDDNPMERNIIRENIPEVTVPELPEDPADYLEFLYGLNLFETVSYSKEDTERTKLYQNEAKRVENKSAHTDLDSFLKSLEMTSKLESFNKFNGPRVAQLSQRSNQFNLRTKRYTEAEIKEMAANAKFYTFAFSLSDRFGDNGLISVVILEEQTDKKLFIDTWFMSCRVLKRGMEEFVLNTLVEHGREHGYDQLVGEYIPTPKNDLVKTHYADLGFEQKDGLYYLNIDSFQPRKCYIKPA